MNSLAWTDEWNCCLHRQKDVRLNLIFHGSCEGANQAINRNQQRFRELAIYLSWSGIWQPMPTVPTGVIFIAVVMRFCSYKCNTNIPFKKDKEDISLIPLHLEGTSFSEILLVSFYCDPKAILLGVLILVLLCLIRCSYLMVPQLCHFNKIN